MILKSAISLAVLGAVLLTGAARGDDENRYADLSPEERAELEARLDATRERLREVAEEVGDLTVRLADGPIHRFVEALRFDHDRALLGVSIDDRSDERGESRGVRVRAVTPGGPAARAGVETGDVIVAIDGTELARDDAAEAVDALMDVMRQVEPGDPVAIAVERDGRRREMKVVTEPLGHHGSAFAFADHPDVDFDFDFDTNSGDFLELQQFEDIGAEIGENLSFLFHRGAWHDMELVELTPTLGAYFGVDEGLLVVRAPRDDSLGVMDGDVIVKLNGEAVTAPRAFVRALGRTNAGDRVTVDIVRQRSAMTLEAQVPQADNRGDTVTSEDGKIVIQRRYADSD